MSAGVSVDARPTARDLFRVSFQLVLRGRLVPTILAAGPVLWAVGAAGGSPTLARLGATVSWLILLVPAFAVLVGTNSAYRPGSGALYEPTRWTFADEGVEIVQPDRTAHAEWSEFVRWRHVARCYLLYTARRRYVVLPERDVAPTSRPQLELLLEAKLGAGKR